MECNPYELDAYVKAYEYKRIAEDSRDWHMGLYVKSALESVIGNLFSKNPNAKYVEKPFFDKLAKDNVEGNNNSQNNEILAALEMEQYISVLTQQGNLPQTTVDIKES